MTAEDWTLAATVFNSGLAAGLLGTWSLGMTFGRPSRSRSDNTILAWDPEAMPADWEAGRRRYFTINLVQLLVSWTAFILFVMALAHLS